MKLSIMMNDNTFINVDMDNYSPEELAAELNNRTKSALTAGTTVVNKSIIVGVVPVEAGENEPNVRVQLNNGQGQAISEFVENYDAAEYASKINNQAITFLVVGSSIVHKQLIRTIQVIEETTA